MDLSTDKPLPFNIFSLLLLLTLAFFQTVAMADNVDNFLTAKMEELDIPGLQVAVIKNNKLIKTASYGVANIQHDVQVSQVTVFNIASITKAFTSVAVMQLIESGQLNLNAPISTYIKKLPVTWQQVTLYQLLSHTSGLPDIMNKHFALIDSAGQQQSWQKLQQQPLLFSPGSAFHYNQTNYLLVGKIIEKISNKDYSTFIRQQQLIPLKMDKTNNAGFAHFEEVNKHQANNYRKTQQGDLSNVLTHFPAIIRAGAGMSSTAEELAQWTHSLKAGKFFKNPSSLNTLWRAAPLTDDTWYKEYPNMHPYALGWYVVDREINRKLVTAGGGQSAIAVFPEDELTLVTLTNLAGSQPEHFIDELAEFYLDDFGLSKITKALKLTLDKHGYDSAYTEAKKLHHEPEKSFDASQLNHFAELLKKHNKLKEANEIYNLNSKIFNTIGLTSQALNQYLGDYQLPNFSIRVHRQANSLFITATGEKAMPIFTVAEDEFVLKAANASITFNRDKMNKVNSLTLTLNGEEIIGKKKAD